MQNPNQQPSLNIQQMQDVAMNIVETICSIVCMPVETVIRFNFGTRYFSPPVAFFSAMLMIFLPLFSSLATGVVNMIPFTHAAMPVGIFGLGSFSTLYFLLSFGHGFRLYRRMIYMELEQNSEFEGPPLPFFHLIPWTRNFWLTRIVLEPIFVFIAATLLERTFIIQSGLATYLHVAAFTLAMKQFIAWYRGWEYLRKAMDIAFLGPILAKLVANQATDDDLAQVHLARLPKNLPPDIREEAMSQFARVYSSGSKTDRTANAKGEHHERGEQES
jgi:hypothetical protein